MSGNNESGGHAGDIWNNYLDEEWLATTVEEIFEPTWTVVDPHHHLWWEGPFSYRFDDLLADLGSGHEVAATMYMESGVMYRSSGPGHLKPVGEVEYANGFAAMAASTEIDAGQVIAGITGACNLTLEPKLVRESLERQISVSDGRLKAIRVTASHDPYGYISWGEGNDPPAGLLFDQKFAEGFAVVEDLGLVTDLMVFYHQLGEVATFAMAHPNAKLVINHTGAPCHVGPYKALGSQVYEEWLAGIRQVAECPNVVLKLGGLVNPFFCDISFTGSAKAPTSDELVTELRPYFDPAIQAFGPERCMFESNFPVDKQSASYHVLWNAFKKIASDHGDVGRERLLSGTAIETYGLQIDQS